MNTEEISYHILKLAGLLSEGDIILSSDITCALWSAGIISEEDEGEIDKYIKEATSPIVK